MQAVPQTHRNRHVHRKAVDFHAILTKIKGANPEAITYGGSDDSGGPFAKQFGLRAKILSGDGMCSDGLSDLAGDATDSVVSSQARIALEKMTDGKAFQAKRESALVNPSRSTLRLHRTRCISSSTQ